jgi:tetratricopeptide (TPR) repeat protein
VYHNTFQNPFIFDGLESITDNPHIRHLWPIWKAMYTPSDRTVSGRPVLSLSLAVNYQISGEDVWSYHALNLIIHILAALVLFGIIRRTLLSERLRERFGKSSTPLAFICAVIWVVHPLQTESVTYVIQRAESLMGLFYLLTLYCAIRGFASSRGRWWYMAAAFACASGMGTKEVMVTAPVMVLLYDRIFVSRSFKDVLARRRWFYAGLIATWMILAALLWTSPRGRSAGFGIERVPPLQYATTQCEIILHYMRLSFWPDPLVLDYRWPVAKSLADVALAAALLGALLGAMILALRYRSEAGYLGVWFFGILAPTSSFIPILDLAFEHRMYLSLAAVVTGTILCMYWIGRRTSNRIAVVKQLRRFGYAMAVGLIAILGLLTHQRNQDYRSAISIWNDTIEKRPANFRAYNNRAVAYEKKGEYDLALRDYNSALEVNPKYAVSHNGRGVTYTYMGRHDLAMADFTRAIALDGEYAKPYNNRGTAFTRRGMYDRAIADCTKAIELNPEYYKAYNNRAVAYGYKGMSDLAIRDCTKAIKLNPQYARSYGNRAVTYSDMGKSELAIRDFSKSLALDPRHAASYSGRGLTYAKMGRYDLAIRDFDKALELNPNDPATRKDRKVAIARQGEGEEGR